MRVSRRPLIAKTVMLGPLAARRASAVCRHAGGSRAARRKLRLWSLGAAGLVAAPLTLGSPPAPALAWGPPKVTVVSSGLENPRGLKFGPDGQLYVAEGGLGGTSSTVGR